MGITAIENLPAVLTKYRDQIYTKVTEIAQKAALAGGDYLARETAVDTGYARSNWVMTINEPFAGVVPAYAPYPTYRPDHHEAVKQLEVPRLTGGQVRVLKGSL